LSISSLEPVIGHIPAQRPPLVAIAGSVVAAVLGVALGFWLTPASPYESDAPGSQLLAQPGLFETAAPQVMDSDTGSLAPADDSAALLPHAPN